MIVTVSVIVCFELGTHAWSAFGSEPKNSDRCMESGHAEPNAYIVLETTHIVVKLTRMTFYLVDICINSSILLMCLFC